MTLPTKEQINDAVTDYEMLLGNIAGVDFKNGIDWILKKINELNNGE